MNTSSVLVILVALVAANLPFVSSRLFLFRSVPGGKPLSWQAVELLMGYLLVGGLGMALEQHQGQIYPQGWEFYAVTLAMFLTFAFPGFVYRYLVHRH